MSKILVGLPSGGTIPIHLMGCYADAVRLRDENDSTKLFNHRGTNAVTARNRCVHEMLKGEYTHLFFMDSDMVFPDGTLQKLLDHDVDVAGGFYVRKRAGFLPNAFLLGERPNGKFVTEWVTEYKEVESLGTGCVLIKREVFEKIPCPWFEYLWSGDPDGRMRTEDLVFFDKAKDLGYKVYCDGTIRCGHVNNMIIWPEMEPNKIRVEPV